VASWVNQKHALHYSKKDSIAFDMVLKLLAHLRKRILRKSYNLAEPCFGMAEKRTMPICFTSEQLKLIEEYAKRRGMLNVSQAIENLVTK
jgi:hypothetical protein